MASAHCPEGKEDHPPWPRPSAEHPRGQAVLALRAPRLSVPKAPPTPALSRTKYGQVRLVHGAAYPRWSCQSPEGSGSKPASPACAARNHQHPGCQHWTCTNRGPKAPAARDETPHPSPLTPTKPSRPRTARPALQIHPPGLQRERGGHLLSLQPSSRPGAKASATGHPLRWRAHSRPGPASPVTATFPLATPSWKDLPEEGVSSPGFSPQPRQRPRPGQAGLRAKMLCGRRGWERAGRPGPLPTPHSCCLSGSTA